MKIFFFTPIFNFQNPNILKNHKKIIENSNHEVYYNNIIGASVEHAKQIAYKRFLETDCDYFFNVDADIYFEEQDVNPIDKLIESKKEIIGGIYVYKKQPCFPAHRPLDLQEYYEKNKEFPKDYIFKIPNEVHEVNWIAGGACLISRKVIVELTKEFMVPNLPMVYNGEYLSEDFAFCQRAREKGYKIFADPKIQLLHFGQYGYSLKDYKKSI